MSQPVRKRRISHPEYLALEVSSCAKHEFFDGQVFAMAGGTPEHGVVTANIVRLLGNLLVNKPCAVLSSDVSVYVEQTDLATYPDASVVCGPLLRHPVLTMSVMNPRVIVEVLSPSTEAYDRGAKFSHFKRLSSFTEYILIATDRYHIDHFRRQEDGSWKATEYSGLDAVFRLDAADGDIAVKDVYAKLELLTPVGEEEDLSPRPPGLGYRKKSALRTKD